MRYAWQRSAAGAGGERDGVGRDVCVALFRRLSCFLFGFRVDGVCKIDNESSVSKTKHNNSNRGGFSRL